MLGDISRVQSIRLVTAYTDMRKSINGLMAIIHDDFKMDPYANALYLFWGRKADRLKALYFDQTGFVLLYKFLDSGRFQWPHNASEVRTLTRQEYRWLLEGLSVSQPKAIKKPPPVLICGSIWRAERKSTRLSSINNSQKGKVNIRKNFWKVFRAISIVTDTAVI